VPDGNHLIPLNNDEYEFEAHEEDLINRQSRRSGMLLNRDELLGFVHFPSDEVRTPRLARQRTRTKAAPVSSPAGILLGHNNHAGKTADVRLSAEQRMQHIHVIEYGVLRNSSAELRGSSMSLKKIRAIFFCCDLKSVIMRLLLALRVIRVMCG
jgi:hypothetical protein